MGKKSKRERGPGSSNATAQQKKKQQHQPPSSVKDKENDGDIETKENLKFEDPFIDELIEENDVVYNNDDDDDMDEGNDKPGDQKNRTSSNDPDLGNNGGNDVEIIQSWHPLMGHRNTENGKEEDLELEMDPEAYKMYQTLSPEWPCLSFDFIRDDYGENRQRFPHTLQAVIGTQADEPSSNQVTVLKLSDLSKLRQDDDDEEEDILGDEYDKEDDDDSDDDDEEDEDQYDLDPILEHYSIPHYGGVNRLRVMPQNQKVVAAWSDTGQVNMFNIQELRTRFEISAGRGGGNNATSSNNAAAAAHCSGPFFEYSGHSTEGFAVDWSNVKTGALATGDNHGNIHLWSQNDEGGSTYTVTPSYETPASSNNNNEPTSVEDLQWSPTEPTVVCAAEMYGHVAVYDTRAPHRSMLRPKLHGTDVNVLSWNKLVSNLLATGSDDGTLCVWDLRHFGGGASKASAAEEAAPKPLARFSCHKTPVTSVEWHPTDESMLVMSDEVGVYIYDLSVEEDDVTSKKPSSDIEQLVADIPPQLLFCHSGSKLFKESHWHPQISSCVMTTAYSGFSAFIPSNL